MTDVQAPKYDRKTAARSFDTIHDILRALSLAQSLLKGRNPPVWQVGNRGVKVPKSKKKRLTSVALTGLAASPLCVGLVPASVAATKGVLVSVALVVVEALGVPLAVLVAVGGVA